MESIIETQRSLHEERERCLDLIVKESLSDKKNVSALPLLFVLDVFQSYSRFQQRERVNSEHRSRELIDRFINATGQLVEIYKDENGERAHEIQSIGGPNEFAEFYSRLKIMKEVHRRNPNEEASSLTLEFDKKLSYISNSERIEKEMIRFSDEEGYGKFLDMHLLFDQYINLKGVKVCFNQVGMIYVVYRKLITFAIWRHLTTSTKCQETRPRRQEPIRNTLTVFSVTSATTSNVQNR